MGSYSEEWEEECCLVSYDSSYEDGWSQCDANDEESIRGSDFARGSRVERGVNYSYAYPDTDFRQILGRSSPHSGAGKGTNYNYESGCQVSGYVHDYNCSYSVTDSAGTRGSVHDYTCDYSVSSMSSMQNDEYKIDCDHDNFDDSSDRNCYDGFDGVYDDHYDYSVAEITGLRSCGHKHDDEMRVCTGSLKMNYASMSDYVEHETSPVDFLNCEHMNSDGTSSYAAAGINGCYEDVSWGNDVKYEAGTKGYGHYAGFNYVDTSRSHGSYAPSTYRTPPHTRMSHHTDQVSGHHPTSYSLHKQPQRPSRQAPYIPPHLRQYSTQRQAISSYHKPSYMSPHPKSPSIGRPFFLPCTDFDKPTYECQDTNDTGFVDCFSEEHLNYMDELHNCHDMREGRSTGFEYVEHYMDGGEVDFGDSNVAQSTALYEHSTADPLKFDSALELCGKERAVILQDCHSLMLKINRAVEEEKHNKVRASLPYLEKGRMDNAVLVVGNQQLGGKESERTNKAGFMMDHGLNQKEDYVVVEINQGNEEKTEQSIGQKRAMKCLELQQKFWGIGSLLSVIPAVPIHHFDDPFLLGAKGVHGVPGAYAACFGEVYSSGLSFFLSPLGAASKETSKQARFTPFYEYSILEDLLASWSQHLQREWIATIPRTWYTLWRPPDEGVQFGTRLGTNMLGWWFDRGRPPDVLVPCFPPHSFVDEALQTGMD